MTDSGARIKVRLTTRAGGALRWAVLLPYEDEEVDEGSDRPFSYPS
jgi:hypothetical protein